MKMKRGFSQIFLRLTYNTGIVCLTFTYFLFLYVVVVNSRSLDIDWGKVDQVLLDGIGSKVTPGCAAIVGNKDGILYEKYFGRQTYDESSPKVSESTQYDLASLTKVLSTTTAVEQFYERGELDLKTPIIHFFPDFAQKGKGPIIIENCMLHNAGLLPDPTPRYYQKEFGCPESSKEHPKLTFSCNEKIKESWFAEPLINPIGEVYVYSDLSMISMQFILGKLAKDLGYVKRGDLREGCEESQSETCYYEAYVRKFVFEALKLNNTYFLPPEPQRCAPAWTDSSYRHELIKGYVSDGNSYANGGVAGHAGLFSIAREMAILLSDFMFTHSLVKEETTKEFIKVRNSTQSSRAWGWDTNAYSDSTCSALAPTTYLHTGYTGTQVCSDPERQMFTILLTNRCYPNDGNKAEIKELRIKYNQQVKEIYDKHYPPSV